MLQYIDAASADHHCQKVEKGERNLGEKRRMSGCEGGKELYLLTVVFIEAIKKSREGGKTIQSAVLVAGAPTDAVVPPRFERASDPHRVLPLRSPIIPARTERSFDLGTDEGIALDQTRAAANRANHRPHQ
jgi:hypothetical protein